MSRPPRGRMSVDDEPGVAVLYPRSIPVAAHVLGWSLAIGITIAIPALLLNDWFAEVAIAFVVLQYPFRLLWYVAVGVRQLLRPRPLALLDAAGFECAQGRTSWKEVEGIFIAPLWAWRRWLSSSEARVHTRPGAEWLPIETGYFDSSSGGPDGDVDIVFWTWAPKSVIETIALYYGGPVETLDRLPERSHDGDEGDRSRDVPALPVEVEETKAEPRLQPFGVDGIGDDVLVPAQASSRRFVAKLGNVLAWTWLLAVGAVLALALLGSALDRDQGTLIWMTASLGTWLLLVAAAIGRGRSSRGGVWRLALLSELCLFPLLLAPLLLSRRGRRGLAHDFRALRRERASSLYRGMREPRRAGAGRARSAAVSRAITPSVSGMTSVQRSAR